MLDPDSIDQMSNDEQAELLAWLEDMVKYVKLKLGIETEAKPRSTLQVSDDPVGDIEDPVGDIVIQDHKQQQTKSMSGRKPSGWTNIGFGKVDDKHV